MKITIISFTEQGMRLGQRVNELLNTMGHHVEMVDRMKNHRVPLKEFAGEYFYSNDALVCIGATGIAVRAIAPFLKDKFEDPAVLCMDELGNYVISLLSGHMGGANELSRILAEHLGANAVITTATDVEGGWAVDEWAKKNKLKLSDRKLAREVSSRLLDGESVEMVSGYKIIGKVPTYLRNSQSPISIYVTNRTFKKSTPEKSILRLIPKNICVGVGCKKDTEIEKMDEAFSAWLTKNQIDGAAIASFATIDLKANEPAILALAKKYKARLKIYTAKDLEKAKGDFNDSEFVEEITGVGNVCERASSLVYSERMSEKECFDGITFASTYNKDLTYAFF